MLQVALRLAMLEARELTSSTTGLLLVIWTSAVFAMLTGGSGHFYVSKLFHYGWPVIAACLNVGAFLALASERRDKDAPVMALLCLVVLSNLAVRLSLILVVLAMSWVLCGERLRRDRRRGAITFAVVLVVVAMRVSYDIAGLVAGMSPWFGPADTAHSVAVWYRQFWSLVAQVFVFCMWLALSYRQERDVPA